MINISDIKTAILNLILILFCMPLAFPHFELYFIMAQFGILIPIYLFFSLFSINLYCALLILCYLFLLILVFVGMPGSIIGWMSMVCVGYLVGASAAKDNWRFLLAVKPFFLTAVTLALWVCYLNYQNPFSQAALSDYFQASSINTLPILLVSSANLYCAMYFYLFFCAKNTNNSQLKLGRWLPVVLCAVAMLTVYVFEFRSGLGIMLLSILVALATFGSRNGFIKYSVVFCGALIIILLYIDDIYGFLIRMLVPGRSDLLLIFEEVSEDAGRVLRLVRFWEHAGFSKTNFPTWSEYFSFSGMSDIVAALFPISVLFFVPAMSLLKLFRLSSSLGRLPQLIILTSILSSFIISLFQPDFFSMFTFFAIISLVYHGEKIKVKKHSQETQYS